MASYLMTPPEKGIIRSVAWKPLNPPTPLPGNLVLIDQTLLPIKLEHVEMQSVEQIWDAIKRLVVRGAPAIGCSAAYGLCQAMQNFRATSTPATPEKELFIQEMKKHRDYLASSRPTAVNLAWALDRCSMAVISSPKTACADLAMVLYQEAETIFNEDVRMCYTMGQHALSLLGNKQGVGLLTHCNAGALASSDWGTALSVMYAAHFAGLHPRVFADETRPLLQGARLTSWELHRTGIDVTLLCDNMAAQVMREGKIDAIFVGADRIAANGDTANKIGTYGLAIIAKYHKVPFYIAAPYSTIDRSLSSGDQIPIEHRAQDEVRHCFGTLTSPPDVKTYNPAFDVTPNALISGIVTERGVLRPPYQESIARMYDQAN